MQKAACRPLPPLSTPPPVRIRVITASYFGLLRLHASHRRRLLLPLPLLPLLLPLPLPLRLVCGRFERTT